MSLSHIDLTNPDHFVEGTPHEWLTELRNQDPVHWHQGSTGAAFWCVTKWEDLRYVSRNPMLFSSQRKGTNMPNPRLEELLRQRVESGVANPTMAAMALIFLSLMRMLGSSSTASMRFVSVTK